ncbi:MULTISPECIES: carbohydrate porin [Gimesia]|uniref:Porin B n=1 Tax=Gimesia algae TaxID=2527971 RepID=A0A517VLC4_9PLAN|nr:MULTISPECIES: carbohydrate porin [Gimesia]QDT81714.1 Porin B precursor [Gimesia maris]QDT93818.1 Porin B precursor [Gimesia algae]
MKRIRAVQNRFWSVFLCTTLITLSTFVCSAYSQTLPRSQSDENVSLDDKFRVDIPPAPPVTNTNEDVLPFNNHTIDYNSMASQSVTLPTAISGNPAAVNITTGSGELGDWLGINENGFRFGGLHITDANGQVSGGNTPGKWSGNTLTVLDFSLDTEKAFNWKGGMIGTEVLFYFGDPVNNNAATVMGYNSLDAGPPDSRVELYQLWYRQALLDDRLILRFGKSVPTYDFNNVLRSIPYPEQDLNIPGLSGAMLTPLYVSPTQLGIMPGYYDSATGVVASFTPNNHFYVQYGFYDGSLATGRKTGLTGPRFDGHYLHVAETGINWTLGFDNKPGKMGIGGWYQTGTLAASIGNVNGADGGYFFASQRLFYERPGESPDGLVAFLQLAATNSAFIETHRYVGAGLTYFGPLPTRDEDSIGFAFAYGKMNDDPTLGLGPQEEIYTWYYQMKLCKNLFFQQNLTYISTPAANPSASDVFALTFRALLLF